MVSRVPALAAAVVALLACVLVYSTWLRPGTEPRRAAPAAGAPAKPAASSDPLPAPKGEPVLRITGVARGNVRKHTTAVDLATLERLAVEQLTVREPFLKRDVTFTGVWMRDLVARAGLADARRIYFHALDDYHVELPVDDVEATGFLAVGIGEEPIGIADGGPIRLVFSSDEGVGAITDNWIWSIDSMRAIR